MTSKRIGVYCASSTESEKKYLEAGKQLGQALAEMKMTLVYGGAKQGVMGTLADGALDAGGEVCGWFPKCIHTELLHSRLTEKHEVDTMHQRKEGIMKDSHALVALPGGPGTLDELMEAITWKRLRLINTPIFIVNLDGFYNPLLELFENMYRAKFLNLNKSHWTEVQSVAELIEKLQQL